MKRTEIERLLPGVFQRTMQAGSPLFALLEVMEALPAPDEEVLNQIDAFFDPYRTPDAFVPFLASWIDLDRLLLETPEEFKDQALPSFPGGMGRLRELVAAAPFLAQWRGTAKGLLRFLETATGLYGFTLDEQVLDAANRPVPFHIRIGMPQAATGYRLLIERIIESEKPAYVTYELQVQGDTENT
jgi:phage tail-like protein